MADQPGPREGFTTYDYRWECPCGRVGKWQTSPHYASGSGKLHKCHLHGAGAILPIGDRKAPQGVTRSVRIG